MPILVSALWGVIAAVFTAMVAAGLLLAAFWALVFGDHPWPAWVMPVIGTGAVLAGLVAGVVTGWNLRAYFRRAARLSPAAARARLWAFLLAGIAAMALLTAWLAHER